MQKAGDTGDIIPANFLDVIGFSAKFRDFIRIFKKAIPTTSLAFWMYVYMVGKLWISALYFLFIHAKNEWCGGDGFFKNPYKMPKFGGKSNYIQKIGGDNIPQHPSLLESMIVVEAGGGLEIGADQW